MSASALNRIVDPRAYGLEWTYSRVCGGSLLYSDQFLSWGINNLTGMPRWIAQNLGLCTFDSYGW